MLQQIMPDVDRMNLNLYEIAAITAAGLEARRCQPCNACNNSYSVAKSFTAAAIGMLQAEGLLDVDELIFQAFESDFPPGYDRRWEKVTIGHALTHKIGFDSGFLDIDVEDIHQYGTDDFLSIVLSRKLAYEPGTHFEYGDAAFYLLSRLVSKKSGLHLDALLMERLFMPLQFQEAAWSRCPLGYPMGATGLYIRTRDMVKLGWVYVNGGLYQGRRILTESWVRQSLANGYGFHPVGEYGLFGKGGMNGQMLLFSPQKRFAVAWHSFEPSGADGALTQYLIEYSKS